MPTSIPTRDRCSVGPQFHDSLVTYLDNLPQAHATLAAFRASDWGGEPAVFVQPPHWPKGKPAASANYKRALVAAEQSGADFALVLEDDVRVSRHLRHNLSTIPIVARHQVDCLTLFIPDLIADPWEREEPHLGYRLAKPRSPSPTPPTSASPLARDSAKLFPHHTPPVSLVLSSCRRSPVATCSVPPRSPPCRSSRVSRAGKNRPSSRRRSAFPA